MKEKEYTKKESDALISSTNLRQRNLQYGEIMNLIKSSKRPDLEEFAATEYLEAVRLHNLWCLTTSNLIRSQETTSRLSAMLVFMLFGFVLYTVFSLGWLG